MIIRTYILAVGLLIGYSESSTAKDFLKPGPTTLVDSFVDNNQIIRHPEIDSIFHAIDRLIEDGAYSSALQELLEMLDDDGSMSLPPLMLADINRRLGKCYEGTGEFPKSLEHFRHAVQLYEKDQAHDLERANSYHNMASVFRYGYGDSVVIYCHKSLDIKNSILGTGHYETAKTLRLLAFIQMYMEQYDSSELNYNECLRIMRRELDPEDVRFSHAYSDIGMFYLRKGDLGKAENYYDKALAISLLHYGSDHPNTLSFFNNLAICYRNLEEYDLALHYFSRSLPNIIRHFGANHYKTGISYKNIAACHFYAGQYDLALENELRSLEVIKIAFGKDHASVRTGYNLMGDIHMKMGNIEQAKNYFETALAEGKDFERFNGLIQTYIGLADIFKIEGRFDQALDYYLKAMDLKGITMPLDYSNVSAISHAMSLFARIAKVNKLKYEVSGNIDKLHQSDSSYNIALTIMDSLHVSFEEVQSKQLLVDDANEIIEGAIEVKYLLGSATSNPDQIENVLGLIEKSRNIELHQMALEDDRFQMEDEGLKDLLRNEQDLKRSIRLMRRQKFELLEKRDLEQDLNLVKITDSLFDLNNELYSLTMVRGVINTY